MESHTTNGLGNVAGLIPAHCCKRVIGRIRIGQATRRNQIQDFVVRKPFSVVLATSEEVLIPRQAHIVGIVVATYHLVFRIADFNSRENGSCVQSGLADLASWVWVRHLQLELAREITIILCRTRARERDGRWNYVQTGPESSGEIAVVIRHIGRSLRAGATG